MTLLEKFAGTLAVLGLVLIFYSAVSTSRNVSADARPFVIKTTDGKCEISIDTSKAPELKSWAETQLGPLMAEWYPKIGAMLPSEGFTSPAHYAITLAPIPGLAGTANDQTSANSTWVVQQKHGEANGLFIHEAVHVVQQYGSNQVPGWLTEGIADEIRWFRFEPQRHGADDVWMVKMHRTPPRFDEGYRPTANFLHWIEGKYDKDIMPQMNAAARQNKYDEALWKQDTGKTLQELVAEWTDETKQLLSHKTSRNP